MPILTEGVQVLNLKRFLYLGEQVVEDAPPESESEKPFAVFALARVGSGGYAATTRPADRGQAGKIGLPGGKLDPGEDPLEAVLRECEEEGWSVRISNREPIQKLMVDGKMVWWYQADPNPKILTQYKEKHRIVPVVVSKDAVLTSGYGNERLPL